ncbi:MAG: hypothetical protein JWR69_306 [Pedosphaera sp.]|nr:hypothetical protein [Pedosphaera sp.]
MQMPAVSAQTGLHLHAPENDPGGFLKKPPPPFRSGNSPFAMIKRTPVWLVFALFFFWKIALFLLSTQPVPANDAFFYDGAVINYLLHGGYYNPSVVLAFPISGAHVFSAYPPFYQVPLLAWMMVFGTSAASAIALHLFLLGLYLLVLLAILRRLQTPAWCVQIAGLFLLTLTFHDRPDTFAQLLGMLALYSWIRSRRIFSDGAEAPAGIWTWLMVLFVVLSLATGLQIGATYCGIVTLGTIAACRLGRERLPLFPLLTMFLVPVALVLLVKTALPQAWAGFQENVRQTPTLTGFRVPYPEEIMKVARTVPAIILVALMLPLSWFTQRPDLSVNAGPRFSLVLLPTLLAALGVMAACLCFLAANSVGTIANYLQPLIVASYLALCASAFPGRRWLRGQIACLLLLVLLGAVRALGMTTWGLACARDVSYSSAVQRVRAELEKQPPNSPVVLSSAFLYEAARHTNVQSIHCDWLIDVRHGGQRSLDLEGLFNQKPVQLVLTQFDYYRRFQAVLESARSDPRIQSIQIEDTATIRTPDSIPKFQRVVQHISWAPIIVKISWK